MRPLTAEARQKRIDDIVESITINTTFKNADRLTEQVNDVYPTFDYPTPQRTAIGKTYGVMCVRLVEPRLKLHYHQHLAGFPQWIPVLGQVHEDSKTILFPHVHVHIDTRFIDFQEWPDVNGINVQNELITRPVCLLQAFGRGFSVNKYAQTAYRVEWAIKRRKCKNNAVKFPKLEKLHKEYEGTQLGEDMICPHRGMPVRCGHLENGVYTCPGHGLQWDRQGKAC
jgi:Rieske [2Fe-2S] domain